METVKTVFERTGSHLTVDNKLLERIQQMEMSVRNHDEDSISFFGGKLVGVHPMRFRQSDRDRFFDEVTNLDELDVRDGIARVTEIDANWKRANDVLSLSCVWLLHELYHAKNLNERQREQGMINVLLIMQYRFLGSLLYHYFKYPANEEIMLKVHASLSYKYALKSSDSVFDMLQRRAKEILKTNSIHRRAYTTLDTKAVVYMVNDMQGRLKEIIKGIWKVFARMHEANARIGTSKSTLDIDGETKVLSKTRMQSTYLRYVHEIASDRNSFVREELVEIIASAMHTMPPKHLVEVLEWISLNYNTKEAVQIEKFIDETLIFTFDLIEQNRKTLAVGNMLGALLQRLRGLYQAPRMANPALLQTKDMAEDIVRKAIRSKNNSVISSVRTGLQLYIVLRTLTKQHYSG